MKKYTITAFILIGLSFGFLTGMYIYKINELNNNDNIEIGELVEDECTYITELGLSDELISASSSEEKTSPNCIVTLKIYYQKCGHLIETKEKIEDTNVNLSKEELEERFPDWEVQKFTETEITLYKEVNDYCNEHYVLKEKDGNIVIYKLDENNKEELLETTNISTKYLEDEDQEKIKQGIFINTKKELNKALEDYE